MVHVGYIGDGGTAERTLRAATEAFRLRGYHGVTTREIAAEAGVNLGTITYHFGGKRNLYVQALRRAYEEEKTLIPGFVGHLDGERAARKPELLREYLETLISGYARFMVEHPGRSRMALIRWFEGSDTDLGPVEEQYAFAVLGPVRDLLLHARNGGAIREDVDLGLLPKSIVWLVHCYVVTGPTDWKSWHTDPQKAESLERFMAFIRDYAIRMLGLNESPVDRTPGGRRGLPRTNEASGAGDGKPDVEDEESTGILPDSVGRIHRAAWAVFAERGYEGASTREIAARVGLNVSTVNYHVGGKRELYRSLHQHAVEQERAMFDGLWGWIDPETVARQPRVLEYVLWRLLETFIDLFAGQPERSRLTMAWWFEERDEELVQLEADHAFLLLVPVRDLLSRARDEGVVRRDVDFGLFLKSVVWLVHCYVVTGPTDWKSWHTDPQNPENLEGFKAFTRNYLERMLDLRSVE